MQIWKTLYRNRFVLWSMTMREITARFAGSKMGVLWLLILPLIFLALYSYVYIYIFAVRPSKLTTAEYLMMIYCALIPFLAFSEGMGASTPSVIANRDIVVGTLFPAELLPVRYAAANMALLVTGYLVLLPAAWSQGIVHWTQALLPLAFAIQLVFMIGVAWICSAIYVFFRDFDQIVAVLLKMLMLVSPIPFDRTMVPPRMKFIVEINPLFPMLELYRGLALRGEIVLSDLLGSIAVAFGTFYIGAFLFTRLKVAFGDYI